MADAILGAPLVKTLCWLQEPKQLPERCDFSYAKALDPCCSDDLRAACRAADHALITLKAAVARDKRERGDAAAALAAAASAVEAWRAVAFLGGALDAGVAKHCRLDGPVTVSWTTGFPGLCWRTGHATLESAGAPRLAAAAAAGCRVDAAMCLATAAWAFGAGAARTLAGGALKLGDLAADGGPLVRASAALREAAGCWAGVAAAAGARFERYDPPRELAADVAAALKSACLGAADRLAVAKALARELAAGAAPAAVAPRLADGAAAAEGAAVAAVEPQDKLMAANLAAASLAGFAVGDLLRARVAAAAERPGDAVAFAARAERRFAALRDAGTKGGWGGHDHAAYPDLTEATRSAYASAGGALGSAKAPGLDAVAAGAREAYDRDNRTIYFASVPATLVADAPLTLSKPTDRAPRPGPFPPFAEPPDDDPKLELFDPERFAAVAAARREAEDIQRVADDAARAEAQARADAEAAAAAEEEKKQLAAEQASFLEVTCPTGFGPGDALWVRGPDGTQVKATVPRKVFGGDKFLVALRGDVALPAGDDPRADAATVVASQHPESTIDSFFQARPLDGTEDADHVDVYTGKPAPAAPAPAPPAAPAAPRTAPPPAPPAAGAAAFWTCPQCTFNNELTAAACAICAAARPAAAPGADADAALARRLAAENAPPPPSEADDLRVAQPLRIQLDEERRQQEARDEAFARSLAQQGPSAPPNPF